jgi:hypothetical protein
MDDADGFGVPQLVPNNVTVLTDKLSFVEP